MTFDMAVLHYTYSVDVPAEEVDDWHEARGFTPRGTNPLKFIGYHYLVRALGMVEPGRSLDVQPTHCPGFNRRGVLAICFCGSTPNITPWFPTEFQYRSGAGLLVEHNIPKDRIFGHGQLYATHCPGRLDIPKIISMMDTATSPYVLPLKEVEMPRFEIVRTFEAEDKDGDIMRWEVHSCAKLHHSNRIDIHCEAPGESYQGFVFRIPIGPADKNDVEELWIGGWDNEKNRGASFYVHEIFGKCGDTRMSIHAPVPIAIEVS